jgi:hypothetical protein
MNRQQFLDDTDEKFRPKWAALMDKYGAHKVIAAWDAAEAAEQEYKPGTHGDIISNARANAFNNVIGDAKFDYRYF